MDSLPEASAPSADAAAASPRLISGGRAIGAFLVLAALLLGIVLLTRNPDRTTPPTTNHQQSGTFALTDSQAIAKFKELDRLRIRAYVRRDLTLIPLITVPDSPAARSASHEIRRLKADSVIPKPHFLTKRLAVTQNSASSVEIRQVLRYDLHFVDESGHDVTARNRPQRQVILWTLRQTDSNQ
ncbi:MAG TPA: hypothetical protein VHV50_08835, partial [Actinomycetota bacterium]|nr:hypothetical protein [Actinomycetota bacterium]